MTEQTIPADNMEEIIAEMNDVLSFAGHKSEWQRGYDTATSTFRARLKALLPKPRTLADELREYGDSLAGVSVGDLRRQLILFADRVETLEKERDEAQDMEGRATANLSIQMDRAERLAEDLSETLEQEHDAHLAEIARLRAREIPDGWRVAEHPSFGKVLTTGIKDADGRVSIHYISTQGRTYVSSANPDYLSFCDEKPDPEPGPGPGCPTHLKTLEEYQNAPAGTIVQMDVPGWARFIKDDEGCWATKGFIGYYTSESMSGTPCVVVEWGSEPVETPEPEVPHLQAGAGQKKVRKVPRAT